MPTQPSDNLPDIPGLLKDPDFLTKDLPTQKRILSRVDPATIGFSDEDYQTYRDKFNSPTKKSDPGFIPTLYKQNLEPLIQTASDASEHPLKSLGRAILYGLSGGITEAGPIVAKEALRSGSELGQAGKALVSPKPSMAQRVSDVVGHTLTAIPFFGPLSREASEALTQNRPGEGAADIVTMAVQMFGDEMFGEATSGLRNRLGPRIVNESLPWNSPNLKDIPLTDRLDYAKFAGENKLATPQAADKLIDQNFDAATIKAGRSSTPTYRSLAQYPLRDKILDKMGTSLPKQAVGNLVNNLHEFLTSGPNAMTPSEMLELQRGTYKEYRGQRVYGDVAESKIQDKMLSEKLLAAGEREELQRTVPGIEENQSMVHKAAVISDGLDYLAKTKPSYFKKVFPWLMGGSTMAVGHLAGLHSGTGMVLGELGSSMMIGYLTQTAVKDSTIGLRVGVAFSQAGLGATGKLLQATSLGSSLTRQKSDPLQSNLSTKSPSQVSQQ